MASRLQEVVTELLFALNAGSGKALALAAHLNARIECLAEELLPPTVESKLSSPHPAL